MIKYNDINLTDNGREGRDCKMDRGACRHLVSSLRMADNAAEEPTLCKHGTRQGQTLLPINYI